MNEHKDNIDTDTDTDTDDTDTDTDNFPRLDATRTDRRISIMCSGVAHTPGYLLMWRGVGL